MIFKLVGKWRIMMRIERLEGNRKIRVLLSEEDLNEMNININRMTPDSPELHRFLFRIMEYIKQETGFVAEHGQVMVEASPQHNGVILTVTRIEQRSEIARRNIKSVRARRKIKEENGFICKFYDFDAMCRYFAVSDLSEDFCGSLYECENEFYLVSGIYPKYITEFAEMTGRGTDGEMFLKEYGKIVAEGEGLKSMIENLKNLN